MDILIVVDMQNDFIDGTLGTKEAQAIVPEVAERIKQAHENGEKVIFTQDTHYDNYLDTMEGQKLPVPHCISGTPGHGISSKLPVDEADKIIGKNTFGCFYLPTFIKFNFGEPDKITLIGLCTDICVISNAMLLKAYFLKTQIVVDSSCCAGVTPEFHENALKAMAQCQIDII